MMRAVVQQIPEDWLAERARLGLDLFDEMWDGVLHMVPPPGFLHQRVGSRLVAFFNRVLLPRGTEVLYETGVYRPGAGGHDYRVPDLVFLPLDRPDLISDRGLEGAPLAVLEIRSPDDETYDKLEFWARLGVAEVIVVLPETRATEVYRLAGARYLATSADERGRVHAASVDARFSVVGGAEPLLRVECAGESVEI